MTYSPNFTHLRVHSEFSLSDGLIRTGDLVNACQQHHYDSVAVTDINNIFGLIKFYCTLRNNNIKPILGAEITLRHDNTLTSMVLLCRNLTGYKHLCELLSDVYLHGYDLEDHQHALTLSQFKGKCEGLIALTGGQTGLAWHYLHAQEPNKADALLSELKTLFNGDCYVEINRLGREHERILETQLLDLAEKHKMPAVATNHACFIAESDFDAHEVRYCISNSYILADEKRPKPYTPEQYFKSAEEMLDTFADLPELLENAYRVAQRCNVNIDLWQSQLPTMKAEDGLSEAEMLVKLSHEGLEKRLLQRFPDENEREANRQAYTKRLDFELEIINQMGFPGYFLIVADFIGWAKAHAIPVGPGRGSGSGSLVAYVLLITDLNPIDYGLLFERFLNPERVSMPDFDIDFCKDRRDEVIDYVTQKYGRDKVAQIATHGTMAAKAAIKDAGRVLGFGYGYVDTIAKLVPSRPGTKLADALENEEDLKARYEGDEEVKYIIDTALALEGLSKSVGKHAAGIVIAPTTLTDFSALYCEAGESAVTVQYDKDDIEAAGLVKFDFLGLRTLTLIDHAVSLANEKRAREGHSPLDISAIPLDDEPTFKNLRSGKTAAVFQVESDGLTDLLKRMHLDKFEQIIDALALYRPGPLEAGMVDDFVNRRLGRAQVEYPHPDLEDTLKDTYGVIVYQEQVMEIARVLAGYSLGQADMLRRAMGKKKPEEMAKQKAMFLEGAAKNGILASTAEGIFDLMAKFAGYGFNKSHSATYALLTYQTGYLKTHYPAAFMSAVITTEMNNTDKIVSYIEECRHIGLTVRAPLVNVSNFGFSVSDKDEIVYGMGAIKGVGEHVLNDIIDARKSSGVFTSMDDFFSRPSLLKKINKRVAEALITAGCFDDIEPNRRYLFEHIDDFLQFSAQNAKNAQTGQIDMFGLSMATPASKKTQSDVVQISDDAPEWEMSELLLREKQSLGLFLSGHPIQNDREVIKEMTRHDLKHCFAPMQAQRDMQSKDAFGTQDIFVGGWVISVRTVNSKFGKMYFVTLDDGTAQVEVKFNKHAFDENQTRLKEDTIVMILGNCFYSERNDRFQINGQVAMSIDQAKEILITDMLIRINEAFEPERPVSETLKSMASPAGNVKAFIEFRTKDALAKFVIPDTLLDLNSARYQQLTEVFGKENISYRMNYQQITGGKDVFKNLLATLNKAENTNEAHHESHQASSQERHEETHEETSL